MVINKNIKKCTFIFTLLIVLFLYSCSTIIVNNEADITNNTSVSATIFDEQIYGTIKDIKNANEGTVIKLGKYNINSVEETNDIYWIVIDKNTKNKTMKLLSLYALDRKKYNDKYVSTFWRNSNIRKWLNNDFYDVAFSDEEKKMIIKTSNENQKNPNFETTSDFDTEDLVYLLSYNEISNIVNNGKLSDELTDNILKCKGTNYFINVGGYVNEDGFCDWWLRTPGDANNKCMNVNSIGELILAGDYVNTDDFGVRPVITIKSDDIVDTEKNEMIDKNTINYDKISDKSDKIIVNDVLSTNEKEVLIQIDKYNKEVGDDIKIIKEDYLKYSDVSISLVGDSIADCSIGPLNKYFKNPKMNIKSGREIDLGYEAFTHLESAGWDTDYFVFSLGSNATNGINTEVMEKIYSELNGKKMIILTVSIPYEGQERNRNRDLINFATLHKNCYIADFAKVMRVHKEYFASDLIHPNSRGAHIYAQIILKTIIDINEGRYKDN